MKPIPNAPPISPKFLARSLGCVISAIAAWAIAKLAAASPAMLRLTRRMMSDFSAMPIAKSS